MWTAYLKILLLLVSVLIVLTLGSASAQTQDADSRYWREAGLPYIQNFSPKDINGNPQNWFIGQDERDFIYVANNHGLLIFDGTHWQLHPTPNNTAARSLTVVGQRIYVGSQGEIGYFEPSASGALVYVSLIDQLPEEHRNFLDVWQTHQLDGAVYFRTPKYLFRWKDEAIKSWKATSRYHISAVANGSIYVRERGQGLFQLQGDQLRLIPGGEFFADKRVYGPLPYDESRMLLVTRNHGLFLYDGNTRAALPSPVRNYLSANRVYYAVSLNDGIYALATMRGGVVIIDKNGQICQIINVESGLRHNGVNHMFQDRSGGLWLALNNGVSRVELPGRFSRYGKSLDLESTVLDVIRFRDRLYVASHLGVHYLPTQNPAALVTGPQSTQPNFNWQQLFSSGFRSYPQIRSQAWDFEIYKGEIYAASNHGIFRLRDNNAEFIIDWPETSINRFQRSKRIPDRFYAGLFHGFRVVDNVNGRWLDRGAVPEIERRTTSILELDDGTLWLGNQFGWVYRLTPQAGPRREIAADMFTVDKWHTDNGLVNGHVKVNLIDNEITAATQAGVKRFDAESNSFIPDNRFGRVFSESKTWVFYLHEDQQKNVWIVAGNDSTVLNGKAVRQSSGGYEWHGSEYARMVDMGDMFTIYPEADGTVWFGGSEGLARYFPLTEAEAENPLTTAIRLVSNIKDQSAVYGGGLPSGDVHPELDYEQNSIRIEFAVPAFDDINANRFQFKLDGFDESWSSWTDETHKDYTGLREGDYTFKVRSKDVYGNLGQEARLAFTVNPPWHRSGLAYLIYGLAAMLAIWGIVQLSIGQMKKRQDKLEEIISERTAEVVNQRNQLKVQADKLQEMDELKTRFFANISHEFRTPLTLIMGLIDKLRSRDITSDLEADYDVMNQNAARLLNLINQLLNLTRLEAGQLKLRATKSNIASFANRIFYSFGSLGEQKDLTLFLNGVNINEARPQSAISIYYDEEKMEKVIYNLLSNAFKFTPYGGEIHLDIEVTTPEDGDNQPLVELRVTNTGPGIPADKIEYVFDRFYQTGSEGTREFEGTGIGLALVKELVELHGGQITLQSEVGRETCFTMQLPFGSGHLQENEILDAGTSKDSVGRTSELTVEALQSTLPVKQEEGEQVQSEMPDVEEAVDETVVLIVEDHHDLRGFIRDQIGEKYRVVEAENGRIGHDLALELIPDLIISDVMMPEMDGYQLCDALKTNEKTNHIPIILLTAKAATSDKLEGLETGADDYLLKPFNAEELKLRVRNLIRLRRQMREKFSAEMLIGPSKVVVPSVNQQFLERVTAAVEDHIDDEQFSVEVLAHEIGMSRGQLHRKLRALTNKSTSEFIRFFRLQRAAELIRQDAGNMAEIAYQVGFNSQAYFTRCFQEEFEMSPTEYRKKNADS